MCDFTICIAKKGPMKLHIQKSPISQHLLATQILPLKQYIHIFFTKEEIKNKLFITRVNS